MVLDLTERIYKDWVVEAGMISLDDRRICMWDVLTTFKTMSR